MRRGVLIAALILFAQASLGHVRPRTEPVLRAGGLNQGPAAAEPQARSHSVAREMKARLIADGLMNGSGWTRNDCTDTVSLVGAPANKSFSFCYKYGSDHPDTMAAIERIFEKRRFEWLEVGWTEFPNAIGGVYKSTWDEGRYLVVIVGGYHYDEGYTDVIVGVAKEKS